MQNKFGNENNLASSAIAKLGALQRDGKVEDTKHAAKRNRQVVNRIVLQRDTFTLGTVRKHLSQN